MRIEIQSQWQPCLSAVKDAVGLYRQSCCIDLVNVCFIKCVESSCTLVRLSMKIYLSVSSVIGEDEDCAWSYFHCAS